MLLTLTSEARVLKAFQQWNVKYQKKIMYEITIQESMFEWFKFAHYISERRPASLCSRRSRQHSVGEGAALHAGKGTGVHGRYIRCFEIVNKNLNLVVNKPYDWLKQIT